MEKIDVVVVGAEGVAESGGIINKVCIYALWSFLCAYLYRTCADWDVPDSSGGQDVQQTILCCDREFQVC